MTLTEHTLNDELGNLLGRMRRRWQVQPEPLGVIEGSSQRPDILITEDGALPVIIEHEINPARSVEEEARSRLGLTLKESGREIRVTIAVRSPYSITQGISGAALRRRWLDCDELKYALFRRVRGGDVVRWPANGWLQGTVRDLALLTQQAMRPGDEIDELAEVLERRIEQAASAFNSEWPQGDERAAGMLREHLRLEDDGVQTRRMAMAILANALIFQQSLAPQLDGIEPPSQLKKQGLLNDQVVLRQWRNILKINYWPIFHVASEILAWMDQPRVAARILDLLHQVNLQIELSDAARSHDLTGFVFQRLIADRKFLATFYTRPESAALLAALALPMSRPLAGVDWADSITLSSLQIGDFACGTGTLLSAVYNRLGELHELHGQDASALHKDMLEQALVGCDVLPMATHLSLTMLASAYPEIRFDDCHMLVMPYGRQQTSDGEHTYNLGSLDLLAAQEAFPTWSTRPDAVGGSGESSAQAERHTIEDGSFDLVIMNPPFTRSVTHEGPQVGVPVPPFAALGSDEDDQRIMGKLLSEVAGNTVYHGSAGLASAFLALADKKLRDEGRIALVLPQSFLAGKSWEEARALIRSSYGQIIVVTSAGARSIDKSFSADTGMGECLLVASKGSRSDGRARFVTLGERPRSELEGYKIASLVHSDVNVRKLEEGPIGGVPINVGDDVIGEILDCPLPASGPWQFGTVPDFSVVQSAWQLARGKFWIPVMQETNVCDLPVTRLSHLLEKLPVYHLDIRSPGKNKAGVPRGPFDIHTPPIHAAPTFPALWAHDASRERFMEVDFDSEAIIRTSCSRDTQKQINKKAEAIWATATRSHIATDFQYNSQSLCVSITNVDCIGGRAWPSVIFPRERRATWEPAFAVWSNSTLGILLFWWQASRQQGGRGVTTVTALPALPTLDLRALSDEQLAAAGRIFEDMKHCPMLPVNQIDEDPVRAELDRLLLTEVLGLPAELCAKDGPMDLLRRKMAAEPSIHGGKKSKVKLEVPEGCC